MCDVVMSSIIRFLSWEVILQEESSLDGEYISGIEHVVVQQV